VVLDEMDKGEPRQQGLALEMIASHFIILILFLCLLKAFLSASKFSGLS
jgi:hypothetical protein